MHWYKIFMGYSGTPPGSSEEDLRKNSAMECRPPVGRQPRDWKLKMPEKHRVSNHQFLEFYVKFLGGVDVWNGHHLKDTRTLRKMKDPKIRWKLGSTLRFDTCVCCFQNFECHAVRIPYPIFRHPVTILHHHSWTPKNRKGWPMYPRLQYPTAALQKPTLLKIRDEKKKMGPNIRKYSCGCYKLFSCFPKGCTSKYIHICIKIQVHQLWCPKFSRLLLLDEDFASACRCELGDGWQGNIHTLNTWLQQMHEFLLQLWIVSFLLDAKSIQKTKLSSYPFLG